MRLASSFLAVTVAFALWLGPAVPPALALSLAVEPVAVPQAKPDKGVCEDTRYGFRFKAPKEWTRIPLKLEEQWQVAKYLSDKPYFYTDPTDGWTNEHKPQATVIAFVTEKVREEAKIRKQKDEKGDDRYVILISNPYKDYLDYMKRTYSGGGWFVSDEKEAKLEDLPVTQYEIKVEKLTRDGPKRIICWVYHTPEVDFAFHWEVLESAYPKLKDTVYDTLKSFKLIARTGSGLPTADTGERKIQLDDYDKQTPEQRKERRITLEQSLHAKAKTSVPDGWQVLQVGRFLVLNHTDEKYARRVAEHCGVIFDWLDEAFPFVGPTEYVRAPILRICKDRDEENSFHSGGDFWFSDNQIEIVISQDNSGFVTGPASKNPKTRDILRDYLKNLKSTVNELKAADEAAGKKPDGAPKTEKEEEEQYKADAQRWKQREKQLLDTTFEKTFRSWTEKDWEAFQATYLKAVL